MSPPATTLARRIHVIGGEATGKTTLARRIGASLGVPVHNLDAVAWVIGASEFEVLDPRYQPSAHVEDRPREERLRMIAQIAAQPGWVTEGKYLDWTDELFARADVIVFLDHVRPWTAIARILRRATRSAVREAGRRERRGPIRRLRSYAVHGWELVVQLLHRLAFEVLPARSRRTGEPTRAGMMAALAPYRDKLVRVRREADIQALMDRLGS